MMSTKSKKEVTVTEEDVISLVDLFTRVPPLLLKMVVNSNKNVVRSFESQVREYKANLSREELLKIEKSYGYAGSRTAGNLKKGLP